MKCLFDSVIDYKYKTFTQFRCGDFNKYSSNQYRILENVDSGVYFRPRKKERGGDGVRSKPCGLVCYRADKDNKNLEHILID